jgi:hypothetical protein
MLTVAVGPDKDEEENWNHLGLIIKSGKPALNPR